MSAEEDEVSAVEAGRLTGLSERTIRRQIAAHRLPARHVACNRYAILVRDLRLCSPGDPTVHQQVLRDLTEWSSTQPWRLVDTIPSPIRGPAGNVEFLSLWTG